MRNRAFTLIELLIVVAIVGILAAIAVPNFLQAMVRAKVSRVQADHHALRNAIEMYRLERAAYPPGTVYAGLRKYNFREKLRTLTSPVSYISALPIDPFPKRSLYEFDLEADMAREAPGADAYGYFRSDFSGPLGNYYFGDNKWMLSSSGPDALFQYIGYYPETETQAEELCSLCSIDVPFIQLQAVVYNASNGTVSAGDIIRWSHR